MWEATVPKVPRLLRAGGGVQMGLPGSRRAPHLPPVPGCTSLRFFRWSYS